MSKRVPYYGDGDGEPTGTCLSVEAHKIKMTFDKGWEPHIKVVCPGNCVRVNGRELPCWLDDWVGELGWETIYAGPELLFEIEDAHQTQWDEGPSINLLRVRVPGVSE